MAHTTNSELDLLLIAWLVELLQMQRWWYIWEMGWSAEWAFPGAVLDTVLNWTELTCGTKRPSIAFVVDLAFVIKKQSPVSVDLPQFRPNRWHQAASFSLQKSSNIWLATTRNKTPATDAAWPWIFRRRYNWGKISLHVLSIKHKTLFQSMQDGCGGLAPPTPGELSDHNDPKPARRPK